MAAAGAGGDSGEAGAGLCPRFPAPLILIDKVKNQAEASLYRRDSATGCFAPELRNARADLEAVTEEPECQCHGWQAAPPSLPSSSHWDEDKGGV